MRVPSGLSLLLIGSGLYWILSSQLISSFTVLSPYIFQSVPQGQTLITIVGVIATTAGFWIVNIDLDEFLRLAESSHGYIFVIPMALVSLDVYTTLLNLSLNARIVELNPFVASAVQYGWAAVLPFFISYLVLSQGLALLMLTIGRSLFGESGAPRFLPFALVCGVSSFGPFSNLIGMNLGYEAVTVYIVAALGSAMLTGAIWRALRSPINLKAPIL